MNRWFGGGAVFRGNHLHCECRPENLGCAYLSSRRPHCQPGEEATIFHAEFDESIADLVVMLLNLSQPIENNQIWFFAGLTSQDVKFERDFNEAEVAFEVAMTLK